MDQQNIYTVVLRGAESLLRVPAGRGIRIAPMKSEYGEYEMKILTRMVQKEGIETPLPRELWIEVTGPAPSIDIALSIAASSSNDYVRKVAFGANAWQGLLTVHLAYDSTPGHRERMFVQNWVQDEVGLPRVARVIDPDLMFRLLASITQLTEKDKLRILRTIIQYTDSLQHWKMGNELYALAHLYMGVEAITPTAIRWESNRRGLRNRKELEKVVLGPSPDSLDSWARRELIFCGDKETYLAAKGASDQLEHGLSSHQKVHELAVKCVEKTATYLRSAILNYIPLTEDDRNALKEKPYAKPMSTGGLGRQLVSTITGGEDDIATPDQAYPQVRWEMKLKDFTLGEDGVYQMRVGQTIAPIIGESLKMEGVRIHFAGATETTNVEVEIETDQKKSDVKAGVGFLIDDSSTGKWVQPMGKFILNCNAVRYMSLAWIQRLTNVVAQVNSFTEATEQIGNLVSQDGVPDELQEKCQSAWQEALQLDEMRTVLSGCASIPEGLVSVEPSDGKLPLISDIGKLNELNDKTVELAKNLRDLLDNLLGLQVFSRSTGNE